MNVTINKKTISLFKGATLKHALLKADPLLYNAVVKDEAVIKDQEGNVTDVNGAVAEGWTYYVESKKQG
ncbi:hypothetical protein H8S33_14280 [Ornithinibacillus sp. BX22]|uniref:Uncharacterized protein n=2 Tax=Ornithinibacillus TaxID=484508 RepID=A0A923L7V0_9BACI|nr:MULTISPECIES: hypothetical protein [Ornithinibacillus]MBC5637960.1 hypothetical protein [Ornithinibacillus hominis]MBS3681849.1 hypothetical protein [Ornithinibacillus massiliensis]